jgi:hypothetical protein
MVIKIELCSGCNNKQVLVGQVHTEGYLESLKHSFTVAVITEVPVFAFLNPHVYSPHIVQVPE